MCFFLKLWPSFAEITPHKLIRDRTKLLVAQLGKSLSIACEFLPFQSCIESIKLRISCMIFTPHFSQTFKYIWTHFSSTPFFYVRRLRIPSLFNANSLFTCILDSIVSMTSNIFNQLVFASSISIKTPSLDKAFATCNWTKNVGQK